MKNLEWWVLDKTKFSRCHDFQDKEFGRQCTKFGSHAVSLQENSSKKIDIMQNNTSS